MKVALIRNVDEFRSLSMPFYADCLREALKSSCDIVDVRLKPDLPYRIASAAGIGFQGYVGKFWSFPRQLKNVKADVYHIVDHSNTHLLASLDPERTVVTCHDLMLLKLAAGEIPNKDSKLPLVATNAFRWSISYLKKAKFVLCDSETTRQDVLKFTDCRASQVRVIYLGINEAFRPIDNEVLANEKKRLGFDSRFTILHVGNHSFYKNLNSVIKSLALLSDKWRKEVQFVKVGADFKLEQRELIQRLNLEKHIRVMGRLDIKDLALAYNLSDLLLFPSLYEGFGWPPLEAMACGTPVVCSDRGSLKEVVGDAALIVNPDDPQSIASGVEKVLEDKMLRENLRSRGLERAKHFTWANTAEQVLKVYKECVS